MVQVGVDQYGDVVCDVLVGVGFVGWWYGCMYVVDVVFVICYCVFFFVLCGCWQQVVGVVGCGCVGEGFLQDDQFVVFQCLVYDGLVGYGLGRVGVGYLQCFDFVVGCSFEYFDGGVVVLVG